MGVSVSSSHYYGDMNPLEVAGLTSRRADTFAAPTLQSLALTLLEIQVRRWHSDAGGNDSVAGGLLAARRALKSLAVVQAANDQWRQLDQSFENARTAITKEAVKVAAATQALQEGMAALVRRPSPEEITLSQLRSCTLEVISPAGLRRFEIALRDSETDQTTTRRWKEAQRLELVPKSLVNGILMEVIRQSRGFDAQMAAHVLNTDGPTVMETDASRAAVLAVINGEGGENQKAGRKGVRGQSPYQSIVQRELERLIDERKRLFENLCLERIEVDGQLNIDRGGVGVYRLIGVVDGRSRWTYRDSVRIFDPSLHDPPVFTPPTNIALSLRSVAAASPDPTQSENLREDQLGLASPHEILLDLRCSWRGTFDESHSWQAETDCQFYLFAIRPVGDDDCSLICLGELVAIHRVPNPSTQSRGGHSPPDRSTEINK